MIIESANSLAKQNQSNYLKPLYKISKILAAFKNMDNTLPLIFETITEVFPLLTAILIEKKNPNHYASVWCNEDSSESNVNAALTKAKRIYSSLLDYTQSKNNNFKIQIFKFTFPKNSPNIDHVKNKCVVAPLIASYKTPLGLFFLESAVELNENDLAFVYSLANLISLALDRSYSLQKEINAYKTKLAYYQDNLKDLISIEKQQAANEARSEFINICGHELKTPLSVLRLNTQITKLKMAKNDLSIYEHSHFRKIINSFDYEIEKLVSLMDNMLDCNNITNNKLSFNYAPVNLTLLISHVLNKLSEQFESYGCDITFIGESNVIGICDYIQIEKVLVNLLTNAMHYGKGKPIHVSLKKNDKNISISILDHGIGISEKNKTKIFDLFQRAISEKRISGLGVGLYIAKKILNAHSGKIHVRSKLNKGSVFIVELPFTPN